MGGRGGGGVGDVVSLHSFRAGGLQVISAPVLDRPDGYGGSNYRLKSGCWHTHRLGVCEIRPARPLCCSVYYVVLSGDILWLTVLQLERAGYVVVSGVLSNLFFKQ